MTARSRIPLLAVAALMLAVGACATDQTPPAETLLDGIVEAARIGQIDSCHDTRWLRWRFGAGGGGVARVKALRALAKEREESLDATGDPSAWFEQRARLIALDQVLSAAAVVPDEASWRSALDAQDKRVQGWREDAALVAGQGFAPTARRRRVWARALADLDREARRDHAFEARIALCLYEIEDARANVASVELVIAALDPIIGRRMR